MRRRFDQQRIDALAEGRIWEQRRTRQETAVRILRRVYGRQGLRLLVEGLDTGRQWTVTTSTLLGAYEPRATT